MWNIKKWFIGIILILYVSRVECDIFGELLMSVKTLHDKVDKISLEQEANREKLYLIQEANNEKFDQLQKDLKNWLLEKESEGEVVKDFQLKINLILEMFYLNSILNFGIPPVLVFQLEVYYEVLKMKSEKIPLPADQKVVSLSIR